MEIITTIQDVESKLKELGAPSETKVKIIVYGSKKNSTSPEPSKWAIIAKRIENDPVHLAGYSKQFKNDMKEFRDNFAFKQDE